MDNDFLIMTFIVIFSFIGYFLPTIVAILRKHNNATSIAILNILLGWIGLGWIVAIIWAFTNDVKKNLGEINKDN